VSAALGAGRLVTQEPDERRPGDEVLRERGQHEPPVLAHVDLAVDLEDRPVGREQGRLVVRAVALVETDLLADVLVHELLAGEQVVLVVLLEDPDGRRVGQRLEVDGGRVDSGGDLHELHLRRPRGEARLAHVLHEAEVAVVDRHHHVALVLARDGPRRDREGGRRPKGLGGGTEHEQRQGDRSRSHRSFLLSGCGVCPVRQGGRGKVPAAARGGSEGGATRRSGA